jgi:hypothetical protein
MDLVFNLSPEEKVGRRSGRRRRRRRRRRRGWGWEWLEWGRGRSKLNYLGL